MGLSDEILRAPLERLSVADQKKSEHLQLYEREWLEVANMVCEAAIHDDEGVLKDQGHFLLAMHGATERLHPRLLKELGVESRSGARGFVTAMEGHEKIRSHIEPLRWGVAPIVRFNRVPETGLPQIVEISARAKDERFSIERALRYRLEKKQGDGRSSPDGQQGHYRGSIELPVVGPWNVEDIGNIDNMSSQDMPTRLGTITLARFERRSDSLITTTNLLYESYGIGATAILDARHFGAHTASLAEDVVYLQRAALALRYAAKVLSDTLE